MNGKKILLLILFVYMSCCFGLRDIFNFEQMDLLLNPLEKFNVADLSFVGSVIENDRSAGYLRDLLGNIYQVELGQKIGINACKVIKIYEDQILLSSGQYYLVIK